MKRIVLVETAGPRNVGGVVRLAANFGPVDLHLVQPVRPALLLHPDFEQMSHGVEDAAQSIVVHEHLRDALADCTWAVAFTARARSKRPRRDYWEARAELAERCATEGETVAFVFGGEEAGLADEHTSLCQELVHIPTSSEHTSLNLAMAVGLVMGSLYSGNPGGLGDTTGSVADGHTREYLKANLTHVFRDKIAKTPAAANDIEAAIERMISRTPLENRDARAWHLMLRALGSNKSPADFGLGLVEKGARRRDALDKRDRPNSG